MADGQVLIDTKIDTGGVERGIEDLRRDFNKMSKALEKVIKSIENGFQDIDIEQPFEDGAESARKNSDKMEDAIDNAADSIKADMDAAADSMCDDLDRVGDQARETGVEIENSLSGDLFRANFLSDIATDALQEVWEFAKESAKASVQYSADIAAANAQFEQAFKDLESTARSTLESIADSTGISATRMQDAYTSIFAFTKSVGADSEQALDISARAMVVAADSAAYYDRSIEDVTETLQSFLKGNYENDAALGIAATETTRNTKANEKYAKSFNELTEAQKVDVLLSMVEAGNEASGAMGQAAREADSWTNVTGELEEAWRQLLAQLGKPVLQKLIPILQTLTGEMQEFTNLASREMKIALDDIELSMESAQNRFKETSEEVNHNVLMAENYIQRLRELEEQNVWTTETQREYANVVRLLSELFPELNLEIDEQTGLLLTNKDAILAEVDAMKQRAEMAAKEELYTEIIRNRTEAQLELAEGQRELNRLQTEESVIRGKTYELTADLTATEQEYYKSLLSTVRTLAQSGESYEGIITLVDQYGRGLLANNKTLDETTRLLYENWVEQAAVNGEIDRATGMINEYNEQMDVLDGTISDITESAESRFGAMTGAMEEDITAIEGDFARMAESVNASIESIKDKTVYIDIYERYHSYGGSYTPNQGGGNSGAPTAYTADSVAPAYVPYLATGAVIPPRAPFYAVLGDQSNGRNLEAPEGLIRQIVREEAGDGGAEIDVRVSFDGDLAQLGRVLNPVIEVEKKRKGGSLATRTVST